MTPPSTGRTTPVIQLDAVSSAWMANVCFGSKVDAALTAGMGGKQTLAAALNPRRRSLPASIWAR